jgi:hypothetical protein
MTKTKICGIALVMIGTIFSVVTLTMIFMGNETPLFTVISSSSYMIGSALMAISVVQDSRRVKLN